MVEELLNGSTRGWVGERGRQFCCETGSSFGGRRHTNRAVRRVRSGNKMTVKKRRFQTPLPTIKNIRRKSYQLSGANFSPFAPSGTAISLHLTVQEAIAFRFQSAIPTSAT